MRIKMEIKIKQTPIRINLRVPSPVEKGWVEVKGLA